MAGKVFAELENVSLSDVRFEDVINIIDVADVPVVAFSDFQRSKLSKRKRSENSNTVTITNRVRLLEVIPQVLRVLFPVCNFSWIIISTWTWVIIEGTGSYLPLVVESVAESNVSGESFLNNSDVILVSTAIIASDFEALEQLPVFPTISLVIEVGLIAVGVVSVL